MHVHTSTTLFAIQFRVMAVSMHYDIHCSNLRFVVSQTDAVTYIFHNPSICRNLDF